MNQETLDWIWAPFKNSSSSSLSIICGRIGYLLDNTFDPVPHYFKNFKLDKRITIPLFILNLDDSIYNKINKLLKESELSLSDFRTLPNKKLNKPNNQKLINEVYSEIKSNNHLYIFFNFMDEVLKLNIISLFLSGRKASKDDWINIWKESKFHFSLNMPYISCQKLVMIISIPLAIISYGGYIGLIIFSSILPISGNTTSSYASSLFLILLILINPFLFIYSKLIYNEGERDILSTFLSTPAFIPLLISQLVDVQDDDVFTVIDIKFFISLIGAITSNYFLFKFINEMVSLPFLYIICLNLAILILIFSVKIINIISVCIENILNKEFMKLTNPLKKIILPIIEAEKA
jgi:hypothetical protein